MLDMFKDNSVCSWESSGLWQQHKYSHNLILSEPKQQSDSIWEMCAKLFSLWTLMPDIFTWTWAHMRMDRKGGESLFGGLKWMSLDKADLPLVAEGL